MQNPNIERLLFIKNLLSRKPCSQDEIVEAWYDRYNEEVSKKTITRDIEVLRNLLYDIEDYIKDRKRYYRLLDLLYEQEILERYNRSLLIGKLLSSSDDVLNISPTLRGLDLVPVLINYIEESIKVGFKYQSFDKETTTREVWPLILKEYQGKWHLHGFDLTKDSYRTYGVDRITDLKQIGFFDRKSLADVDEHIEFFKKRMGAAMPLPGYFQDRDIKPEIIRLWVSSFLLNYIKSKPAHQSQFITKDIVKKEKFTTGEILDYTLVEYYLVPNYDLVKFIISGLGDIILDYPADLKEYITKTFGGLINNITKQ